jgi:DNA-binding NarL/FixJ family response regulator
VEIERPVRVILVSSSPAVRAGLRALIGADPSCEVVGDAGDLTAGALPTGAEADVVVVDADPDLGMLDELADATSAVGPAPLILGPVLGDQRLPAALAGRAWGYLQRDASPEQLTAAVRAVGKGLVAVDPSLADRFTARTELPMDAPVAASEELTTREREVLQFVALGLANKTIAQRLGISEHTVKFHVAAILAKLGAGSRTEAVHLGARRGLVAL